MIQGTGSHVGKSIITAALCRIFYEDGIQVCPFKAQNMSLNSFVTKDGGEMGRAQVVQAEAAKIDPSVDMNPILLKPEGENRSQVIVLGKPTSKMDAERYYNYKGNLLEVVKEVYFRLKSKYELIVIEGAGSPVEVNIKDKDIVNMKMAEIADAPVLLVADIDKGGVFAQIVGTMELLTEKERERVNGFIINKFRGDINILKPGLDFINKRTKRKVLGVIPYFTHILIDEEDSVGLKTSMNSLSNQSKIDIAVIKLPHISNFTDFDPLKREDDVSLRYITRHEDLGIPDLIIIPGSKSTIYDLLYLKKFGLFSAVNRLAEQEVMIIGICGGFQMLGKEIKDPLHVESKKMEEKGFGLLNVISTFEPIKDTNQVKARAIIKESYLKDEIVSGYEIHMGRTNLLEGTLPIFKIFERSGKKMELEEGAISEDGRIWGTYIHGIFDNNSLRRRLINYLREKKGLNPINTDISSSITDYKDGEYKKLAKLVRDNLDMKKIYNIIGI
jgi:adenosylcobyric acid synthase